MKRSGDTVPERLEARVARALREEIDIVPYDPLWPGMFVREKSHLLKILPAGLLYRIEHFGSTAVPGMAAKPVIDILAGVVSLEEAKRVAVPILESRGYEYFWRPSFGDHTPPYYAWFIKRDCRGIRTHHIHMVERDFEHWERLLFRDYLAAFPEVARRYGELKQRLSREHPRDRAAYTEGKADFIVRVTALAREYYGKRG
ncbi:MAG: GrpB family protein [Spirochaetes bacterium]|nr:GrpB family protein [Spirochaetota bacterium]